MNIDKNNVFSHDARNGDGYPLLDSGSSVIRLNETTRLIHLVGILPASIARRRTSDLIPVNPFWLYSKVGVFLAIRHFNERNSVLVPKLASHRAVCDLRFTTEFLDTQQSPIVASRKMLQILNNDTRRSPTAFVGAVRSAVTQPLSILSTIYRVPIVSGASTSAELDAREDDLLGRTVPTNVVDANAVVAYLKEVINVREFGILFVRDPYGVDYQRAVALSAVAHGLEPVVIAAYADDAARSSVQDALRSIKRANVRYVFAILTTRTYRVVLEEAVDAGVAGNEKHVWLHADGAASYVTSPDNRNHPRVMQALRGAGHVQLYLTPEPALQQAYHDFTHSPAQQEAFWSLVDDRDILEPQYNFSASPPPDISAFYSLTYDAVIAIGLAACSIQDKEFFTGPELYDAFLQQSFVGASGLVNFHPETGTRSIAGLDFGVFNVIPVEDDGGDGSPFESVLSTVLAFRGDGDNFGQDIEIQTVRPFVYWDGTTNQPPHLPFLVVDMRLISLPIRIVGLTLCGLVMLMSVAWALFTCWYRDRPVVRSAQPEFLYMTCIGTLVMASTIIPMSFQEPMPLFILDRACMGQLWTLAIGFTTVFSALFCKMWRLNRVFAKAKRFRRVQVRAKDVIQPFFVLLSLNVVVLLSWSLVDPLRWVREEQANNRDGFGRAASTVSYCRSSSRTNQTIFFVLYVAVNLSALVIAIRESYRARHHPADLNESRNVVLTMASLLEETILGLPVVFLLGDSPEARFLVLSVLVSLMCVSVLLPTFIPKFIKRKELNSNRSMRHTILANSVMVPPAEPGSSWFGMKMWSTTKQRIQRTDEANKTQPHRPYHSEMRDAALMQPSARDSTLAPVSVSSGGGGGQRPTTTTTNNLDGILI